MIDLYSHSLFARTAPFDPRYPGSGVLGGHITGKIVGGSSTLVDLTKAHAALVIAGKSDDYLDTVLPEMAALVMAVRHYVAGGSNPRFMRMQEVCALRSDEGWAVYSANYDTLMTADAGMTYASQQFTVGVGYAAYYDTLGEALPRDLSSVSFSGVLLAPPAIPLFWSRHRGTQEQP